VSRILPAACIRKGDEVRLTDEGEEPRVVAVRAVHFATPRPGLTTWETDGADEVLDRLPARRGGSPRSVTG
jgi:hypothetical protein